MIIRSSRPLLALMAGVSLLVLAHPATAKSHRLSRVDLIEQRLEAQEKQLDAQAAQLKAQAAEIDALKTERDGLRADISKPADPYNHALADRRGASAQAANAAAAETNSWLADIRATGDGQATPDDNTQEARATAAPLPAQPVGEAPPSERKVRDVAALPEQASVLTPKGQMIFTPSAEYVRSSANRLVFRGVEIVPGIQLGVIEANDADRNSLVGTAALRYGLTSRLEIEGRLPYVDRFDRVTTVAQRDETISRTMNLKGQAIGDVEVSARYQLNDVRPGQPVYVASLRIKSPTGTSPYDVTYDQFGAATSLATGSGFWAAEGGVTMLYPTDPAVIFASLSYLHNVPRNIDKTIGTAMIGRVEPGDSIGASLGFGLSLNPRFSISLGYSHNYIFETKTQIGGTVQKSNSLQVGSMLMGWSFRLNDRVTLSNNFQFGVTSDAPNLEAIFSLPVRF